MAALPNRHSCFRWRSVRGGLRLGLLLLAGCGSGRTVETGNVSGRVTLGGEPLAEGIVFLVSEGRGVGASAPLGNDGRFALPQPIEVGDYKVIIQPPPPPPPMPENSADQGTAPAEEIPVKYKSEKTTDLEVTVVKGENTADFDLEP